MPLTPAEARKILEMVPAAKRELKTYDMRLPELIGHTGNDALSRAIVDQASSMLGDPLDAQAKTMQRWCDEQLGKGLVKAVMLDGAKPAVAELDLGQLKQMCKSAKAEVSK